MVAIHYVCIAIYAAVFTFKVQLFAFQVQSKPERGRVLGLLLEWILDFPKVLGAKLILNP